VGSKTLAEVGKITEELYFSLKKEHLSGLMTDLGLNLNRLKA